MQKFQGSEKNIESRLVTITTSTPWGYRYYFQNIWLENGFEGNAVILNSSLCYPY